MITEAGQRLLKDVYDRRADAILDDIYRQESLLLAEIQPGSGRLRVRRGFNRAYGWGMWWVDEDGARRSAGPFADWSRAQAFADTMSHPGRVTDVAALARRIEASRVHR